MYKLLILTLIISYCIYHIMTGQRGVLSTLDIEDKIQESNKKLMMLVRERSSIENKIRGLNANSINYDLVDELIRREMGMSDQEEMVIVIKNAK